MAVILSVADYEKGVEIIMRKLAWICLAVVGFAVLSFAGLTVRRNLPIENKEIESLAVQYYDALIQQDFKTAFSFLYRSDNNLFPDESLISEVQATPPTYYKVTGVKQLADGVYEVSGIGESSDGQGRRPVTNYAISHESKYYIAIHWSDVPAELYDFGKIIGF